MRNISRFAVLVVMAVILSVSALAAAPGLNVLTGTADPLTLDGMESAPSYVTNAVISDSPFSSENGKVLLAGAKDTEYSYVGFSFNPALDKDRAYQVSFKVYQDADTGYGKYTDLWIMKNGTSGWQIAKNVNGLVPNNAGGWMEHSHFVNTFASLTNSSTGALDTTDVSKILFEWHYDSAAAGTVNQRIYFDDISIVPAYKITYIDEDGTVMRTAYEHIEGASFKPVLTFSDNEKHILGWSKENDGTVDEIVTVTNEDFNLYAIYDNTLNIDLSADKTLFTAENEGSNITSSLWHRNGTDGVTVSYSVTEGAEYVTLTDNGDGSAKIVSKGEGMSVVTCTASTGESENIYVLGEYMTVEMQEKVQTTPTITESDFLYDHKGSVYSTSEGAWEFVKSTNVLKPDGTSYYTNGFLSKSGAVDTSVYKYLLFRVKANEETKFQAAVNASGTWKYAYPLIANTNGAYVDVSVDISSLASNGTISQWVLGVMNHHNAVYVKDITLSNIPTYEPQVPDIRRIKLLTTVSEIEDDSAKASVKAALFYNKGLGGRIDWKSDDECITIASGGDGNAQISAVSNGSATVTAYAQDDESVSASFDVTVSGQREKQAVYDFRILFWGASTTKHPPAEDIGWYGNWGMAASAEENDYVHKLVSYLEEKYYPSKVTYEIIANANFDAAISAETSTTRDWSTQANFLEVENAVKELRPNIIATAQTGNMKSETPEDVAYNAYKQLYDMVFSYVPDAIVVAQYCGTWHSAMKEQFMARLGEDYSDKNFYLLHNDVAGVSEYLAPGFANAGVANHWGDKGHERVAQQCFDLIDPRVPSVIEASYIYVPESIEIEGADIIDEKGGSLRLAVTTSPSDASDSVTWSIDNSNYAVIGKDGVLTALNNGTVTVTATSDFDETVTATHTVKIINQSDVYTLTYAAGTTDEVQGLPEADDFAGTNYALSTAIPSRAKYDFVGWGLSENAEETVTVLDVTKNTTVYAIWKKTEGFEFEGTYSEENGFRYNFSFANGFHVNVRDSKLWTTCTAGEKVTFISPEIDVVNKNFVSFGLVSAYADASSTVEMTVTTAVGQKTFVYPLTSTELTTYVADISSLDGNITGVSIYVNAAPSDNSMFEIGLDFVRFTPVRELSAADGGFAVTDGDTVFASKQFEGASTVSVSLANAKKSRLCVTVLSGIAFECEGTDTVYASAKTEDAVISVNVLDYNLYDVYKQSCAEVYGNTADGFVKVEEYSDVLTMYDSSSIRTKEPCGIRIKASVTETLADNTGVAEYGFVIARKDSLDSGKIRDLVLEEEYISSKSVVYGKAYSKSENIHKCYQKEENVEIITAVLTNMPANKEVYETPLVFRVYIKLEDGTMLYGAKVEKSILDAAKAVYFAPGMDDESRLAAKSILDLCGFEADTLFLPVDDLFNLK